MTKADNGMTRSVFEDRPPESMTLTTYDEAHLDDYLRLIDADDQGETWQEVVAVVFGIDVTADPVRARAVYAAHLARARWMTEIGYAYLLGPSRAD